MNFQKKRRLTNYVLVFFFLSILSNCGIEKEKKRIVAIANAVKVESEDYYFSEEADIYLGGNKYSFRDKIEYDSINEIERLLIYYPDGVLKYNKSDLKKDFKLFSSFGYPEVNSFIYENGVVYDGKGGVYEVEKLEEIYLKSEREAKNVVFYILGS